MGLRRGYVAIKGEARTVFVFPGQGSQYPGMGRSLYHAYPEAKEVFDTADEVLAPIIGRSILRVCFEGDGLEQTRLVQPAIFTHSVAAFQALGLPADIVGGHSLGEYAACVAAGALRFEDGLKLVAARGLAMQNADTSNPGGMAALLGDITRVSDEGVPEIKPELVETLTSINVEVANFNTPSQLIVSGTLKALQRLDELVTKQNDGFGDIKRSIKLPIAVAAHSSHMEGAKNQLKTTFDSTEFLLSHDADLFFNNGTMTREAALIRRTLLNQLTKGVYWWPQIKRMLNNGNITQVYEVGAKRVLLDMMTKRGQLLPGLVEDERKVELIATDELFGDAPS